MTEFDRNCASIDIEEVWRRIRLSPAPKTHIQIELNSTGGNKSKI